MKKIIQDYTFDASARTITASDFNKLSELALITNVTDNIIIYNFADAAKGGVLSGRVLTLDHDTTLMDDTDKLQIITHAGTDIDRIGFAKAISSNIDTTMLTLRQTGSGMTVNQTGGNLVLTTGTTARSETIIRGLNSYSGGIRARIQNLLSQRIANQQFFFELVDVVGDSLAYSIGSATAITVTLPASFGLSSQNIGQSMTLCGFSGTGTFLSGRYPIASVSGDNATFTVSGFAAGTGTLTACGWNFYRLEYSGTTATNTLFDASRSGYASGNTTATITTTASPGHMAIITGNDGQAALHDQLVASTAAIQTSNRATRVVMVPDDAQVYMQIRVLNGSTAPASTTTWTIGQVSVGHFEAESVIVQDMRPTNFATALPVEVARSVGLTVSLNSGTATIPIPGTVTDVTSSAITTTTTTSAFTPTWGTSYLVNIPVTAVSGTTPTMSVRIEESDDSGTNWYARYTFPTIIATGIYRSPILRLRGNRVRYVQTITGTTPSFTRIFNRNQRQDMVNSGYPGWGIFAASTNATSVLAAPCEITKLSVWNRGAAAFSFKIYDKASAPTVGTDVPVAVYEVPGSTTGAGTNIPITIPDSLQFGFAYAATVNPTTADTTALPTANVSGVNYSIG
jgi:hypothetical protein